MSKARLVFFILFVAFATADTQLNSAVTKTENIIENYENIEQILVSLAQEFPSDLQLTELVSLQKEASAQSARFLQVLQKYSEDFARRLESNGNVPSSFLVGVANSTLTDGTEQIDASEENEADDVAEDEEGESEDQTTTSGTNEEDSAVGAAADSAIDGFRVRLLWPVDNTVYYSSPMGVLIRVDGVKAANLTIRFNEGAPMEFPIYRAAGSQHTQQFLALGQLRVGRFHVQVDATYESATETSEVLFWVASSPFADFQALYPVNTVLDEVTPPLLFESIFEPHLDRLVGKRVLVTGKAQGVAAIYLEDLPGVVVESVELPLLFSMSKDVKFDAVVVVDALRGTAETVLFVDAFATRLVPGGLFIYVDRALFSSTSQELDQNFLDVFGKVPDYRLPPTANEATALEPSPSLASLLCANGFLSVIAYDRPFRDWAAEQQDDSEGGNDEAIDAEFISADARVKWWSATASFSRHGDPFAVGTPSSVRTHFVSVVIVCATGDAYLREAIRSVLEQDFGDFELILVDDASTGATAQFLQTFQDPEADLRVRVIRHAEPRGFAASAHTGFLASIGAVVMWLPANAVLQRFCLTQLSQSLSFHPTAMLAFADYKEVYSNGTEATIWRSDRSIPRHILMGSAGGPFMIRHSYTLVNIVCRVLTQLEQARSTYHTVVTELWRVLTSLFEPVHVPMFMAFFRRLPTEHIRSEDQDTDNSETLARLASVLRPSPTFVQDLFDAGAPSVCDGAEASVLVSAELLSLTRCSSSLQSSTAWKLAFPLLESAYNSSCDLPYLASVAHELLHRAVCTSSGMSVEKLAAIGSTTEADCDSWHAVLFANKTCDLSASSILGGDYFESSDSLVAKYLNASRTTSARHTFHTLRPLVNETSDVSLQSVLGLPVEERMKGLPCYQRVNPLDVYPEKFTMVFQSYKRTSKLLFLIRRYTQMEQVAKIVIIWNNLDIPPPSISEYNGVTVEVIQSKVNSMNNRFIPQFEVPTDAIFMHDDDLLMSPTTVLYAFDVWKQHRCQVVGWWDAVHYANDSLKYRQWDTQNEVHMFSQVLVGISFFHKQYLSLYTEHMPQCTRDYVDKVFNCDDILINFLASNATRLPPVTMGASVHQIVDISRAGLSWKTTFFSDRDYCLQDFAEMFGGLPLKLSKTVYRQGLWGVYNFYYERHLYELCGVETISDLDGCSIVADCGEAPHLNGGDCSVSL